MGLDECLEFRKALMIVEMFIVTTISMGIWYGYYPELEVVNRWCLDGKYLQELVVTVGSWHEPKLGSFWKELVGCRILKLVVVVGTNFGDFGSVKWVWCLRIISINQTGEEVYWQSCWHGYGCMQGRRCAWVGRIQQTHLHQHIFTPHICLKKVSKKFSSTSLICIIHSPGLQQTLFDVSRNEISSVSGRESLYG